ncbi:unnamed protein product [Adineta steineri]|uniref:Uncharacterized protein n=1 Tax=Adineta steineri TaxID=433720 RepID=A0A815AYK4_9BILA|nr:unnamed protein product [Adineta steineri]CAF1375748.1 unnamed protein product [Adineta steineri]CAF3652859.1 unnamed protein product [Adineta steineri]CAF3711701.1 unnamed protein product [Adineta steineri]
MYHRLSQLFILGCFMIYFAESNLTFNGTTTNKIFCYSCKGSLCETILNEEDNVITCNKHTQLCWSGFVDQQPYRTCASRYCTPNGISMDSDIRIEACCHTSLCNSVPLSWSIWSKWYKRNPTQSPELKTSEPTKATTKQTTTIKTIQVATPVPPKLYIVNEIVNNGETPLIYRDEINEKGDTLLSKLQLNASNPDTFGIQWDRVPYDTGFSNRIVSLSKLVILLLPILLVLLF